MTDYQRTHTCGELSLSDVGKAISLSGWVHRRRDLGGLIFIDLRDRFGVTQLLFDPDAISKDFFDAAYKLRNEWVIHVKGRVSAKLENNPKLKTGQIEVQVSELVILSAAKTPPFSVNEDENTSEELLLKHRYLDMRRGPLLNNLILRHEVMQKVRTFFSGQGFIEVTTPVLGKSTPEGARDYLVPSRVYPGNFYALPQSPQIFKQLLMVSGLDRYFQIASCFRDEDLRADRQPEFSQIDLEMSFATPEQLMLLIEELLSSLFNAKAMIPFRRMTYQDCIENYGTDRPDLRFEMPLLRIDAIASQSSFSIFLDVLAQKGCVKAICVKGGADLSRKNIDEYTQFVSLLGLKGLAWIKRQKEGFQSSLVKFFEPSVLEQLAEFTHMQEGDLLFIAAGSSSVVNQALDHLRRKVGRDRGLIRPGDLAFLWVVDFPLLKWNEDEGRMESEHHPFTSPHFDDLHLLETEPLKVRALAYDIVLNGYELGGGSQRIHNPELQQTIFKTLNLSEEDIKEKFGFFVEALQYGTPPHLGIALGLDRLIMLLAGTDNIRDVIAFPKTQKASDLMMQCPSPASPSQLKELGVKAEPTKITWL
ncbi:MAG: Aspartyl-tRNA synthetase [Chlamydiota bacterium]|jgi:aspartyl-tRNA synthetase